MLAEPVTIIAFYQKARSGNYPTLYYFKTAGRI